MLYSYKNNIYIIVSYIYRLPRCELSIHSQFLVRLLYTEVCTCEEGIRQTRRSKSIIESKSAYISYI